jgi:hypothetical protein
MLAVEANAGQAEIPLLVEFLSASPPADPIEFYHLFMPQEEYDNLLSKDPFEANRQYWREIDGRLDYLRGTSHRLLSRYLSLLLQHWRDPIIATPFLRCIIEVTAKAVGYHWAAIIGINALSHEPPIQAGNILESKDIEDLLLSYSHGMDVDLLPLRNAAATGADLVHAVRSMDMRTKHKPPTMSKLLAICTFISSGDGATLRYCYKIACDIVHSGPTSLALGEYMANRDDAQWTSDEVDLKMHGNMGMVLALSYPRLCYEVLRCASMFFSRYVYRIADRQYAPVVDRLITKVAFSGVIIYQFDDIRAFISGDNAIIAKTSSGDIRIYK